MSQIETITLGLVGSLGAGLGTVLGALPVLLPLTFSQRIQGIFLGLGGGIMLAATAFSLIVPGIEAAIAGGSPKAIAAATVAIGILLGGGLIWLIHDRFPHEHFFKGPEGPSRQDFERIWLFIIAITLHNFPEGLAVGVGFGSGDAAQGIPLAVGIGLQNIPEGLVVALALKNLQYSNLYALGISALTGLVEPVGGLVGAGLVSLAEPFLPWGMAIAAGAMLFVIVDEIIPEINHQGLDQEGTLGVICGFVTMMFLDVALG